MQTLNGTHTEPPSLSEDSRRHLERIGRAMPATEEMESTRTMNFFGALDNFAKMFDIHADDKVVLLLDRMIDPRVVAAIDGFSRARGPKPIAVVYPTTNEPTIPESVKPILDEATFVVSTWACSIADGHCIALRKNKGQRWVKITYFRDYDIMYTPQARFPVELVGEIIRATAARYQKGNGALTITDDRGTDFRYDSTPEWMEILLKTNRWKGELTADRPGCYVHYLPVHGPNVYHRTPITIDKSIVMPVNGVVYPQWAVGFPKPFSERIGVHFVNDRIAQVTGESEDAAVLRDMLMGGTLVELGCGFNPKAPRHNLYPAGSNSPGVLHFGINSPKPSSYLRRVLPQWEEPPTHMDLVTFDSTVHVGSEPLITAGFLESLRDPSVVEMASKYGDPVDLLEGWPN